MAGETVLAPTSGSGGCTVEVLVARAEHVGVGDGMAGTGGHRRRLDAYTGWQRCFLSAGPHEISGQVVGIPPAASVGGRALCLWHLQRRPRRRESVTNPTPPANPVMDVTMNPGYQTTLA